VRKPTVACLTLTLVALAATPGLADVVEIGASKDNSMMSESGDLSNGSGEYTFAGKIALGDLRRALYAFDVAGAVPADATIDNVTLTLNMSRTIVGAIDCALHRVQSDWGEGASDAPGEEGTGVQAQTGDATWQHTFYDTDFWGTAGGDFDASASAVTSVSDVGFYNWSSAGMTADVQGWLDFPSTSHGWIVICDEDIWPSAKRFDSKENANSMTRPVLSIEYTPQGTDTPAASNAGLVVAALILMTLGAWVVRARRSAAGR